MHRLSLAVLAIISFVTTAYAQHASSPYAGYENRYIAALSEQDIADLEAGAGWGLALPAELNGVPGPTHLLELSSELDLSETQIEALTELRDAMQTEAIQWGQAFIEAERSLNNAFVSSVPSPQELERLVQSAADARSQLRSAHLKAHLTTVQIVSEKQVQLYNRLRGYEDNPCASVPEGHDEAMWRRHNGCW
jgi:Spy/CpxP family protein refolding chaperone